MAGLGIEAIGQVAIPVRDVARARDFYRDELGLAHLFDAGEMSFFQCGAVRLMLAKPEGTGDAGASVLYYRVPDLEAADAALKAGGTACVAPPHKIATLAKHDLWMAFYRDTEQNLFALMNEVPLAEIAS